MEKIFTLIVGATIGYCTNWLAIKMLFKPYNKIKFLGITIPFTPGLIPKERKRISKQIGKTIGGYLLTEQVLVNELTSEKIKQELSKSVEGIIYKYCDGNYTYDELFNIILGYDNEMFFNKLDEFVVQIILNELTNEQNHKNMVNFITNKIANLISEGTLYLHNDKFKSIILNILKQEINRYENIKELAGENQIEQLKNIISYHIPELVDYIKMMLEKEEVSLKAKEILSNLISEKVGALGAMFINVDNIYCSALEKINELLENEDNQKNIAKYLDECVNKMAEKSLDELIPIEIREQLINRFSEKIYNNITDENTLNTIIDKIYEKQGITSYMDESLNNKILKIISEKIYELLKIELVGNEIKLKNNITNFVTKKRLELFNSTVTLSNKQIDKIVSYTIKQYVRLINDKSRDVLKTVNISEIIEKEINAFDIQQLEEMILLIAKKELSAITWFGALLGFIMAGILLFVK